MEESALVLRSVCKQFGATIAVDSLDLDVRPGELVALVGPSGSGKSTVLHLITGMLRPDRGEVRLLGNDLTGMAPGLRDVAMVWQDGALYPHLTVAQNLAFPLRARGKTGKNAVKHMAERLDISELLDRLPAGLSGGERQRVALGRALIRKPKLFLLDAPLSSLDPPLRERMRNLIRDLVRETGVTTIYVTHDQGEAMAVGDRVVVMKAGRIEQAGTPQQIYLDPANAFVACFFGTPPMNLLTAKVVNGQAVGSWGTLLVPKVSDGGAVRIGFRPENVFMSESKTEMCAQLTRVVYQGHETIAAFDVSGEEIRMRVGENANLPETGAMSYLHVPADGLYVFASETGERL